MSRVHLQSELAYWIVVNIMFIILPIMVTSICYYKIRQIVHTTQELVLKKAKIKNRRYDVLTRNLQRMKKISNERCDLSYFGTFLTLVLVKFNLNTTLKDEIWMDFKIRMCRLTVLKSSRNHSKKRGKIFITLILTCSIFPEMYERRVRNLWRSQVGPNLENFKESWSVIWHNFHPWKALFALSLIFCWSPVVIRQFIRLFEIFPPEPICFIIHETAPITPWIR